MAARGRGQERVGRVGLQRGEREGPWLAVWYLDDAMHLPKLREPSVEKLRIVVPSWKALVF